MRDSITNSLLRKIEKHPPDKETDIWDARLTGFILRVRTSGKHSYLVEYARGKKYTLGGTDVLTPTQARELATQILGDAARGIDPMLEKRRRRIATFGDFIKLEYGPWFKAHRRTGHKTMLVFQTVFAELQGKRLDEIAPLLIEQWRRDRLQQVKASTVNRELGALKAAFAKAAEWELIDSHPLAKVKPSKEDHCETVRFLSPEEETRLRIALDERESRIRQERASANAWRTMRGYAPLPDLTKRAFVDHLKPMVLLAMNTGMRRGELFGLTWEAVDLGRALLTVKGQTAKSGTTRHIPLNGEALSALTAWRDESETPHPLVFPSLDGKPFDNIATSWEGLLKLAGIRRFRWHDLRHHFASRLVMAGVDLNTVRELLGHADIKMTLRYAHLAPEHKAAAVAKLTAPTLAPVIPLPIPAQG